MLILLLRYSFQLFTTCKRPHCVPRASLSHLTETFSVASYIVFQQIEILVIMSQTSADLPSISTASLIQAVRSAMQNHPSQRGLRVVLTGFMGCGKSTLGRKLAQTLGLPFLDTDKQIEKTMDKLMNAYREKLSAVIR